jgi:prepilin-type N-terminal cleavage/methylation domain-containing protein
MKRNAFTLIELLVVIAIIAILAAILFPVFAQAKVAAKKTQALAQMKQVGTSVQIYLSDYDDMMPPKVRYGYGPSVGGGDPYEVMTWDDFIQPYAKNWQILMSNSDTRAKADVPNVGQYRRSFAPAGNIFRGVQYPATSGNTPYGSNSSTSVPEVSSSVMFLERRQPNLIGIGGVTSANWRSRNEWLWDVAAHHTRRDNMPASDPRAQYGEIAAPYSDGSIFVMADTSAKWLKANGRASDGMLHGTLLRGYKEGAYGYLNDLYWDQGISCVDWPWRAEDGVGNCTLPGE